MSDKVSGELLPCPLCGGDARKVKPNWVYCNAGTDCDYNAAEEHWQALPRVSGELAEIVERMRKRAAQMRSPHVRSLASNGVADLLDQYAKRIATHAEKPGDACLCASCNHWIGGEVRGRCGRDERAETSGERGPGVLGPFGGHGEPPQPPSTFAAVDLADRLDYVEVHLGHDTTKESREMLIAIAAQLRAAAPEPAHPCDTCEHIHRECVLSPVTHGPCEKYMEHDAKEQSAPEPARGQAEAWVEFEDPDEIGVELLITDVHLMESDLHTERWVRVPVHGAPQTEPGPATPESPEALYYCASRVVDTLDADPDVLDVAHHELRMAVKRIRRAQPTPVQVPSNTVGAVEGHLYVHGAPQTEQGDGPGVSWWEHIETVEAMERHADALRAQLDERQRDCDEDCESTMDELRDKLKGAYDSLREHMDMVKAERDRIAELEETETTLRKRNGRLGEHNRRWMDRDADNLDRIAELELALDNACRIMEEEMDDRLVPWKEFVTGLQPAPDSPAETDEGPCGGCEDWREYHSSTAECRQVSESCDALDSHHADMVPCRRCNELPGTLPGPHGLLSCGCDVTMTPAQWIAENKQAQLPPHPKPNKA